MSEAEACRLEIDVPLGKMLELKGSFEVDFVRLDPLLRSDAVSAEPIAEMGVVEGG